MNDTIQPVAVTILGKEYRIACSEEESDDLLRAARYLDSRMKEIRDSGRVLGLERIAVMAALNIVHELFQRNQHQDFRSADISVRLTALQNKLDRALQDQDPGNSA